MTNDALDQYRATVRNALAPPSAQVAPGKPRHKPKVKKEKCVANKDVMRAHDWSVNRSVNPDGLAFFQVETYPKALSLAERRFKVPVDELPPEIIRCSPDRKWRVCVEDAEGNARLECVWGERPRAWFHTDRGAVGWLATVSLFSNKVGKLRGGVQPDICHTRQRGHLNAYYSSGE